MQLLVQRSVICKEAYKNVWLDVAINAICGCHYQQFSCHQNRLLHKHNFRTKTELKVDCIQFKTLIV